MFSPVRSPPSPENAFAVTVPLKVPVVPFKVFAVTIPEIASIPEGLIVTAEPTFVQNAVTIPAAN